MENKTFLISRYLTAFIIILGITFTEIDKLNFFAIILILLFIINTQLRYFLFRDISVPVFISIIFDFIFGYILYKNYNGLLLPYFIIGIIDSFFLIENFSKYILGSLGLLIFLYAGNELPLYELLSYITAIITLGLISSIIKKEQNRTLKAEELYHRLRKSEDELIKTNHELEAYADSIKELSILKERNRISREIHDSVGHSLSTIIIQLGAIEKIANDNGEAASLMASNLRDFTKNGLEEIRKALRELKPKEFKEYETLLAIEGLIKDFSKLTGIDVKLGFSKNKWQLDEETSLVLYRVVQEFLSNSARHGKATKISIFMHFSISDLIVTMQDNGIGTNEITPGLGLTSISERVGELGGNLSYESKEGKGFLLRVVLKSMY
ncbi:two-component sensor histidine kinase [Tissierella sp. P1]|uniref:sensor histidine kinase n=1 Tax=Tissierella sp. P1 TaxID=1280483 RepID=UPI000BA146CF|nr:sensor histidine kinase [Tissierella sp. P1]OZV10918.1 two-component sensor histidine kinase [Tissierella sp. P1]